MTPRLTRKMAASQRKSAGTQRTPQSQTSGIFKLPLELFHEILSYFNDHQGFIRRVSLSPPSMRKGDVERSSVVRRLTMTCRALRNALLPDLWKNVEGCIVYTYPNEGYTYGLYAQCEYLLSNPIAASYVQVFSVDLDFQHAPRDLMKKFINTLVRLPNLRSLNLLRVSRRTPVTAALKRKCAMFPNIREMVVDDVYPDFIKSCPNLESLTFRYGLFGCACRVIKSYGAGLKRVTGLDIHTLPNCIETMVQNCPELQEIGLVVYLRLGPAIAHDVFNQLRQIKYLAIVEVDFIERKGEPFAPPQDVLEDTRNVWKHGIVELLKNNTSESRKLLRWCTIGDQKFGCPGYEIVESGEMEVFPETSL